jgi:hypothetical protein
MFKNSSTFYRIIIHTVGVLFLIGMLGSTALGDEGIISTVVQTIYQAAFGPVSGDSATQTSSSLPPAGTDSGVPGGTPPPPDTLK